MTQQEIDRIESAIRHIQTSTDIDPWALEIAVESMQKQIDHIAESGRMVERTDETAQNVQDDDLISRKAVLALPRNKVRSLRTHEVVEETINVTDIEHLPSAQPEYEPVTAEDFAKTMSEVSLYGFMAWHGEALALMEGQGFVICKKTM